MATPLALVTAVGAASLAAPRRNEILMTLIFPLLGVALARGRSHIVQSDMVPYAGIFPSELTALRAAGLLIAAAIVAYAVLRRRSLRNVDVLILLVVGLGLAIVSGTELTDRLLSAFSFEKGNGGRILGLAVFSIFILFLLILRALSQAARNSRQLSAVLEGLAWEEFRQAELPRALPRQDRDPRPRLQRGREHRPGARPDAARGLRRRDRGAGRRRRLARRHRRRRRRARRGRRPPRDQPRRRRGAAHRLPADGRIRRRDRRHPRRRRPAPALGDGAPGRAGARRRGRRRPRLARARRGRPQPLRPRARHRLLQPPRLLDHAHQGQRLLERLPRGAHHACCRSSSCARSSSTPPSS